MVGYQISAEAAQDWVRESLAQGSGLAALVITYLPTFTTAVLLIDSVHVPSCGLALDNMSRSMRLSEAEALAAQFLRDVSKDCKLTLVVEDDLARRGDPNLGRVVSRQRVFSPAAFVGDRVIRWAKVEEEAQDAAKLLRHGSSGYPLNAYLCRGDAAKLGLQSGAELSTMVQDGLARSVVGVLVTVWDAETFVAVLSPEAATKRG
jgi:hypothetical protein